MARYPGAEWRPTRKTGKYGRMPRHDAAQLHVSASASATSLWGWWQNPDSGGDHCHFHIDYDGRVEQYEDTDFIAYASRQQGSLRCVSIETQGGASGKWTAAQVVAIVRLLAWICATHDIPVRDMQNSLPSSRGIGTHRYGIDPWRVPGGEVWSGPGKVCPGDERQAQLPMIIEKVSEEDVELSDNIKLSDSTRPHLGGRANISVGGAMQYAAAGGRHTMKRLARMEAEVRSLTAAVSSLAENVGLDPDDVRKAIDRAVDEALADLKVVLVNDAQE